MLAAHMGHEPSIRELIRAGADLNIQEDNETALTLVNFPNCLSLLYEAGAEVNITPLADKARQIMTYQHMGGTVILLEFSCTCTYSSGIDLILRVVFKK